VRTSGVRRRASAPIFTAIIAAPTPPVLLPSRSAFAARATDGHHGPPAS
jgi:hypothetical protein